MPMVCYAVYRYMGSIIKSENSLVCQFFRLGSRRLAKHELTAKKKSSSKKHGPWPSKSSTCASTFIKKILVLPVHSVIFKRYSRKRMGQL